MIVEFSWLKGYFPIFVFLVVSLALAVVAFVIGKLLSVDNPDDAKCSPYECGFEEFSDARAPFDIRYYLVAILFILFDLETALFFLGISLRI